MDTQTAQNDDSNFMNRLDSQIAFQRKWRLIMMTTYISTTIFIMLFSSSATILAAIELSHYAAIAAAATTVLVSIEKSLLFREKWKLHVTIQTNLENIKLLYDTKHIDLKEAAHEVVNIMERYSTELPISSRD
ncbi:MAG: hypothetical protein GJT30_09025 [Geobacter sp.]|nr:hypothetical protein [Geobacter sp.]